LARAGCRQTLSIAGYGGGTYSVVQVSVVPVDVHVVTVDSRGHDRGQLQRLYGAEIQLRLGLGVGRRSTSQRELGGAERRMQLGLRGRETDLAAHEDGRLLGAEGAQ